MKKLFLLANALIACSFCPSILANSNHVIPFSPYADLTLNSAWSAPYQDMEPVDLAQISEASQINNFHLAFITDAGSCKAAWGSQASFAVQDSWGKHLTDKLKAAGIQYTVAFGGANGNDLSMACDDNQLANTYEQIIATYQPNGIDFDIENGTANALKIMNALKKIQNAHPDIKISFTLPVMPEGLTASGEEVVKDAQQAGLTYSVNIMAMDFGGAYNKDMADYSIAAAQNLFVFIRSLYPNQKSDADIWNMIQITPMIGVNDVNTEQFTLADAATLSAFAKQNGLGGLSMWSVSRDQPCADKWASPVCSGNNLESGSYEFAKRFLG